MNEEEIAVNKSLFPWQPPAPGKLVNRKAELNAFRDLLRRVRQQRPLPSSLLEWHGGPGIGKTELINLFIQVCQEADSQPCHYSAVNFKQLPTKSYLSDPTQLIEKLAIDLLGTEGFAKNQLKSKLDVFRTEEHPAEVVNAYFQLTRQQLFYERPAWVEHMRDVMTQFLSLINEIRHKANLPQTSSVELNQPIVLFFDETENADPQLINWLEQWLIVPLLSVKHCLIIWTARTPWRWQRPDIRNAVKSEQLATFTLGDSKQQLENSSMGDTLAAELFAMTHGHPAANTVAIETLQSWAGLPDQLQPSSLAEEKEKELLESIFDKVVLQYAFGELSEEQSIACRLMALVRWFDTVMLHAVLKEIGGALYDDWTREDFGYLLQQLRRTNLLGFNKGYIIDPALSLLIREYYQLCQPEVYQQVNQIAGQVYADWLVRSTDSPNLYVLEELYHLALRQQAGEAVSPEAHLEKRLKQYQAWIPDDPERRQHLLELLQGAIEKDVDLRALGYSESMSQQVERCLLFNIIEKDRNGAGSAVASS